MRDADELLDAHTRPSCHEAMRRPCVSRAPAHRLLWVSATMTMPAVRRGGRSARTVTLTRRSSGLPKARWSVDAKPGGALAGAGPLAGARWPESPAALAGNTSLKTR